MNHSNNESSKRQNSARLVAPWERPRSPSRRFDDPQEESGGTAHRIQQNQQRLCAHVIVGRLEQSADVSRGELCNEIQMRCSSVPPSVINNALSMLVRERMISRLHSARNLEDERYSLCRPPAHASSKISSSSSSQKGGGRRRQTPSSSNVLSSSTSTSSSTTKQEKTTRVSPKMRVEAAETLVDFAKRCDLATKTTTTTTTTTMTTETKRTTQSDDNAERKREYRDVSVSAKNAKSQETGGMPTTQTIPRNERCTPKTLDSIVTSMEKKRFSVDRTRFPPETTGIRTTTTTNLKKTDISPQQAQQPNNNAQQSQQPNNNAQQAQQLNNNVHLLVHSNDVAPTSTLETRETDETIFFQKKDADNDEKSQNAVFNAPRSKPVITVPPETPFSRNTQQSNRDHDENDSNSLSHDASSILSTVPTIAVSAECPVVGDVRDVANAIEENTHKSLPATVSATTTVTECSGHSSLLSRVTELEARVLTLESALARVSSVENDDEKKQSTSRLIKKKRAFSATTAAAAASAAETRDDSIIADRDNHDDDADADDNDGEQAHRRDSIRSMQQKKKQKGPLAAAFANMVRGGVAGDSVINKISWSYRSASGEATTGSKTTTSSQAVASHEWIPLEKHVSDAVQKAYEQFALTDHKAPFSDDAMQIQVHFSGMFGTYKGEKVRFRRFQ